MNKNNIGIRNIPKIGVADIDVYNTNKRKFDGLPPKNAEKVKLRVGVFFDGTGNNSYNSDAVYYDNTLKKPLNSEKEYEVKHKGFIAKNGSSYFNRYSNVKLLHDLYETKNNPPLKDINPYRDLQLKVYMQGIGTLRDFEDDTYGTGFGEGERGVIGRVQEACNDIAAAIDQAFIKLKQNKPLFIESIEFDVFGFSRGAAAARHFCNEVLKQEYATKSPTIKKETRLIVKDNLKGKNIQMRLDETLLNKVIPPYVLPKKLFSGGKLGEALKARKINYPATNVAVEFLGLFDTVIAQLLEKKGAINFARNNPYISLALPVSPVLQFIGAGVIDKVGQIKKVNPDVSNPNIKKVFQIHASNEWRENFALTPLGNCSYGSSIRVLGAHSNVGGCYNDSDFELNTLHFFDFPLDATESQVEKSDNLKSQLRQWYINNLFCQDMQEIIYWETMHHVRIYNFMGNIPGTDLPVYNDFYSDTALLKDTVLGNETSKVIDGKKYQLAGYHYKLKSKRKLNNKLSLVYMNVMKHMATTFANVPFLEATDSKVKVAQKEEYNFDKNYELDKIYDSNESYQDLMIKVAEHGWALKNQKPIEHKDIVIKEKDATIYKIPVKMYEYIKLNFVHLSANYNETLSGAEKLSEYQFAYPSVPNLTFENDYKEPPYKREEYTPKLDEIDKK
jgi:hypothetical protein